jgi:hypothetical protein
MLTKRQELMSEIYRIDANVQDAFPNIHRLSLQSLQIVHEHLRRMASEQ